MHIFCTGKILMSSAGAYVATMAAVVLTGRA